MEFTGAGGAIHTRRYRYHDKCEGDVSYKVSKDNGIFHITHVSSPFDCSKHFTLFIPAPTRLLWEAF